MARLPVLQKRVLETIYYVSTGTTPPKDFQPVPDRIVQEHIFELVAEGYLQDALTRADRRLTEKGCQEIGFLYFPGPV